MTKIKINFIQFLALALLVASFQSRANASEAPSIISKVIKAYGGKTLTNAKSLKIIDHNKGPWPGHSENPGLPEIWRINEELTIDFTLKRKSLLSYRVPRTTLDLERWVFDGEKGRNYDIFHKKYSNEDWVSFNNLGGSIVRSSDTMHARRLHSDLKEATFIGNEYFRGRVHQILTATFNSGAKFTYLIDQESGLIRKATRHHPLGDLVYVFSNHQLADGLTYASDMNFFVNGELRLASVLRGLALNPDLEEAFNTFNDFESWGETVDSSEMQAKQIANGIFQAGEGRSQTVFIEQPDHYIAIGGANALKANFEEIKKLAKSNKPLGYFVVTHHHRNNLNGLDNALELGAKLVTAKAHKETIKASVTMPESKNNIVVVKDRKPFTLGNLTLIDIPTSHSQHYLLAYSAQNKMVIAEEHYETNLKTAKPRIYRDMVIFGNVLDSLDIDVEYLVDIRSWRKIPMEDFSRWTAGFKENICPAGYDICAKG